MRFFCSLQLFLFSLFYSGVVVAQQEIAVADLDLTHAAYEMVANPLTIGMENCPCDKLSLSVDEGQLQKGPGPCEYIFTPAKPGKAVFMINKKTKNGFDAIGKVTYRIKALPSPVATISGKRNGPMPVAVFKAAEGMIAKLDGFEYDVRFKVASFRMEVIRNGKVYLDAQNNKNVIEPVTRTVISHVLPGDTISFTNIVCRKPNDTETELESFFINITE